MGGGVIKFKRLQFYFSEILLFVIIVLTIITIILALALIANADKSPSKQDDMTCTLMLVPAGKSFVNVPVCYNKDKP